MYVIILAGMVHVAKQTQRQINEKQKIDRGNRPERFVSERVSERAPGDSERTPCIGELVTECTSQRSRGTLSEAVSEPLLECHFPLRVPFP